MDKIKAINITDSEIEAMATDYANKFWSKNQYGLARLCFKAGISALRDKLQSSSVKEDKIEQAIKWCDEKIKEVDPLGDAAILRAPYKEMKQYLIQLQSKA